MFCYIYKGALNVEGDSFYNYVSIDKWFQTIVLPAQLKLEPLKLKNLYLNTLINYANFVGLTSQY